MEMSKNHLAEFLNKAIAYKNQIIVGLVITLVLASGTGIYLWNRRNKEAHAHRVWVDSLEYFNAPVSATPKSLLSKSFQTSQEKWEKVAAVYDKAYTENKSTGLAPFFLALKAEAQTKLGQIDAAISTLSSALPSINSSEIQDSYTIKLALMKFDSSDQAQVQQGLATLTGFAQKDTHFLHDYVLYQLGEYYWAQKQFDKVKNYWKMLTLKYSSVKSSSPWVSLVKDRLALIGS